METKTNIIGTIIQYWIIKTINIVLIYFFILTIFLLFVFKSNQIITWLISSVFTLWDNFLIKSILFFYFSILAREGYFFMKKVKQKQKKAQQYWELPDYISWINKQSLINFLMNYQHFSRDTVCNVMKITSTQHMTMMKKLKELWIIIKNKQWNKEWPLYVLNPNFTEDFLKIMFKNKTKIEDLKHELIRIWRWKLISSSLLKNEDYNIYKHLDTEDNYKDFWFTKKRIA